MGKQNYYYLVVSEWITHGAIMMMHSLTFLAHEMSQWQLYKYLMLQNVTFAILSLELPFPMNHTSSSHIRMVQ